MEKHHFKVRDRGLQPKSKQRNNQDPFRQTGATKNHMVYGFRSEQQGNNVAEVAEPQKKRRRKRNRKGKDQGQNSSYYSSGQAFVSGGILQPAKDTNTNREKDEGSTSKKTKTSSSSSDDDDEIQFVCSKGNPPPPTFTNMGRKEERVINKQSIGPGSNEFETYGIGAKLLANMGFQPGKGLGKDLQGISSPIEAYVRKGRGAIGAYGPECSTATKVSSAAATQVGEEQKLERFNRCKERQWDVKSKWQKTNNHKVEYSRSSSSKNENLTADHVLEQRKSKFKPKNPSKVKVIDLTGPEKKVFRDYNAMFGQQKMLDEWANRQKVIKNKTLPHSRECVFELPDLVEDVVRLEHNSQQEILDNNQKARAATERMAILNEEMKRLTTIVNKKKQESVTSIPAIKEALKNWNPLDNPEMPVQLPNDWASLIGTPSESAELYEKIFWECWLPSVSVRQANRSWNVKNPEPMVNLIEFWKPRFPTSLLEIVYDQVIIPKLTESVENWDPSLSLNSPLHSWIHPWLPYVGRRLEILYPTIRSKLSKAFVTWHPSDIPAKRVLIPWTHVFSKSVMDTFLLKNIVPKLQQALQELIINPENQNLDPWKWVMVWLDMVPKKVIVNLLETMFFPKWLQFLATWLNQVPSYGSVHQWYLFWRGVFEEYLKNDPVVLDNLRKGLEIIGASLKNPGQPVDFSHIPKLTSPQPPTVPYVSDSVSHSTPEIMADAIRMTSHIPHGFKELVQMKCEELGIVFMPVFNRYNEGRQVYKCGNELICISGDVIFVQREGRGFHPTSLNRLILNASK